jgi:PAS domain S-box-containing protein
MLERRLSTHREQEQFQDALFRIEQLRKNILDSTYFNVATLSPDGILLEIGQTPSEDAWLQNDVLIGKPFVEASWWSCSPVVQQQLRHAIQQAAGGENVQIEIAICPSETFYRDIDVTITPRFDADHNVRYLTYGGRDITQRRQAEEEIRVLVDAIPQLVWIARPDGSHDYCNQQWYDYVGLAREQTQGMAWIQSLHPEDQQNALHTWQTAVQTGAIYEVEQRVRNGRTGEYRWFLVRGVPCRDAQGKIKNWFGTCTDVHDKKQMEEALRLSEARFKALFDANIIGIGLADPQGRMYEVNEALVQMFGYTREELLSNIHWDEITPPEFRERDLNTLRELREQGVGLPFEKEFVRKDGRRVPVVIGSALLSEESDIFISFMMDVTDRKQLEQRKDEFISIASHELKTPLTVLKLLLSRLSRKLVREGITESEKELVRMEAQVNTLTRLINDLLDVSKIQLGKFDYIDEPLVFDTVVREVVNTLQQITTTHTLCLHSTSNCQITADANRLEQVVTNLISNAIKYSPQADKVDIDLAASEDSVLLKVRDYGVGIPRKYQKTIFDSFNRGTYTRKERGFPGLGMGLYISREIVKQYGGSISVESEEGEGSTFAVSLPLLTK